MPKAALAPKPLPAANLHRTLSPVLLAAQLCGLLPVAGILAPDAHHLIFRWRSPRLLYTLATMLGALTMLTLVLLRLSQHGFSFYKSTGVVFYLCALVTNGLFVRVAHRWPPLMQQWAALETHLALKHVSAARHIRLLAALLAVGAAVEHGLSVTSSAVNAHHCWTPGGDLVQAFYELSFPHIFAYTTYALWKALLAQWCNILCTFSWNFMDLFIMVMSIALTDLFSRITSHLKTIQTQLVHEHEWRQIRADYNQICGLFRALNATISDLVFLSFASNLYFICAQLLHSLKTMQNTVDTIYFFYSMIYLMARTVAVALIAARIYEESRKPLQTLFAVPGYSYCAEVSRFVQQIGIEIVALTGMNFFAVRRGIVLTIAGTIVTYELVLLQFNIHKQVVAAVAPPNASLHRTLRPVLVTAQLFGLLPVAGVLAPDARRLSFSWRSPRLLFNVAATLASATMLAFIVLRGLDRGFSFYRSTSAVFFLDAILVNLLFVRLARNWPPLMRHWAHVERLLEERVGTILPQQPYRHIRPVATLLAAVAAVEHGLSLTSAIYTAQDCWSTGTLLQAYNEVRFTYVFAYTSYTHWKGWLANYIQLLCTFIWNFTDLFIMVMSLALADLFDQITHRARTARHQAMDQDRVWRQIRADYNRVCNLCRALNDAISGLVLLSFASDLYFICAQLLHSIKPVRNIPDGIYFFYSMIYLMVRTLAVTLIAARIPEASRVPLQTLFSVPGHAYCAEMGRFVQQIGTEIVALTGMNFFAVRRGIVLTVAGTIVTYELVLVQFNASRDLTPDNATTTASGQLPCLI